MSHSSSSHAPFPAQDINNNDSALTRLYSVPRAHPSVQQNKRNRQHTPTKASRIGIQSNHLFLLSSDQIRQAKHALKQKLNRTSKPNIVDSFVLAQKKLSKKYHALEENHTADSQQRHNYPQQNNLTLTRNAPSQYHKGLSHLAKTSQQCRLVVDPTQTVVQSHKSDHKIHNGSGGSETVPITSTLKASEFVPLQVDFMNSSPVQRQVLDHVDDPSIHRSVDPHQNFNISPLHRQLVHKGDTVVGDDNSHRRVEFQETRNDTAKVQNDEKKNSGYRPSIKQLHFTKVKPYFSSMFGSRLDKAFDEDAPDPCEDKQHSYIEKKRPPLTGDDHQRSAQPKRRRYQNANLSDETNTHCFYSANAQAQEVQIFHRNGTKVTANRWLLPTAQCEDDLSIGGTLGEEAVLFPNTTGPGFPTRSNRNTRSQNNSSAPGSGLDQHMDEESLTIPFKSNGVKISQEYEISGNISRQPLMTRKRMLSCNSVPEAGHCESRKKVRHIGHKVENYLKTLHQRYDSRSVPAARNVGWGKRKQNVDQDDINNDVVFSKKPPPYRRHSQKSSPTGQEVGLSSRSRENNSDRNGFLASETFNLLDFDFVDVGDNFVMSCKTLLYQQNDSRPIPTTQAVGSRTLNNNICPKALSVPTSFNLLDFDFADV